MSNFIVSARKYRPKTFDEVVGQSHVSDTLKKALQSEKLAHAYLFCGPRGVGKTTCARILAKVVNCENPIEKNTPCGICHSCKTFEDNASFNILELDAASNNSVENIRSLIEQVRIQPQSGKYKIFIIDEVHMLSQSAFNAFLKTLEEPPSYVIFIMATTEKHKILPTILSRCQIYDFKRIQASDIVPQLNFILQEENKTADPEALYIIGQKADGAMRDALSIFDRIASSSANHITYKDVVENLNILDYDYFFSITDNLLLGRIADILLAVDDVLHKGFEADQFIHGLSEHFRNLLMLAYPETVGLLDVGDTLKNRYLNQARIIRKDTLMSFLNITNDCDISYTTAKNKRLHIEVALSKMNYASLLLQTSNQELLEKKTKLRNVVSQSSEFIDTLIPHFPNKISHDSTINNSKLISDNSIQIDSDQQQNSISDYSSIITIDEKIEVIDSPQNKSFVSEVDVHSNLEASFTESDIKNVDDSTSQVDKGKSKLKNKLAKLKSIGTSHADAQIPIVSLDSFELIEDQIRKESLEKESKRIILTEGKVREIIEEFCVDVETNSLKQTLEMMIIRIENDAIKFFVPSMISKESVAQQDKLMDLIRVKFDRRDIAIPVIIDADQFPDYIAPQITSVLTDKEKYIQMTEKNKVLVDLQKSFDLQPI